jgi:hypothetical protein
MRAGLGRDCRLTRGEGEGLDRTCGARDRAGEEIVRELRPLDCRLTRGDGEGLDRTSGARERAADEEAADRELLFTEPSLLDCRSTRREGEGLDRTSGARERSRAGAVIVRELRLGELEKSDPPTLGDRDDPRSTCGAVRVDGFLSTLDSFRAGAGDVLGERFCGAAGAMSVRLFRC